MDIQAEKTVLQRHEAQLIVGVSSPHHRGLYFLQISLDFIQALGGKEGSGQAALRFDFQSPGAAPLAGKVEIVVVQTGNLT